MLRSSAGASSSGAHRSQNHYLPAAKKPSHMPFRILGLFWAVLPLTLVAQLQSPDEFLPHNLGETFTPHHTLVDYFEHVAENSDHVQLIEYGRTNEDRPLLLAFVSTPENLARLDAIRENNLRHTGLVEGSARAELNRAIVWLSYSVHGNEASGSEASMGVVYDLANPANTTTKEWLENTIVVLDPSINPDGYSRYTHWFRGVANRQVNPTPRSREHREPWPGGRVNHYLFDLNRDWAWQTQVESRQRMVQYQRWMPHIHADLHEQYYDNPYYFAPAARPYHQYITDWQGDFQTTIGKNHAKYFDRNGWLYFTKEVFDLFYPSYGDTYPTFNGAIGMTYEQGGHSRGGRAIETETGDTLTLADRVAHHRATSLSTVEVASENSAALLENFQTYFRDNRENPQGEYRSYLIKGDNAPGKLRALTTLLDRNGIQYGTVGNSAGGRGYDYRNGREVSFDVEPGDLVVSAYQPRSVLAQVLFDPSAELEDSLTYDITAWALPYAYGLEAYASTSRISADPGFDFAAPQPVAGRGAYAYAIPWNSLSSAQLLAQLLQQGVKVRYATKAFRSADTDFPAGTLVVTEADNRKVAGYRNTLDRLAYAENVLLTPLETGFSQSGPDLGSAAFEYIDAPHIALVSGESTSANSFGHAWYFFEQDLEYPVTVIYDEDLKSGDLSDYDILVLPEGYYDFSGGTGGKLSEYVDAGGKLIALGSANRPVSGIEGFALSRKPSEESSDSAQAEPRLDAYGDGERRSISNFNPGSIFRTRVDDTHPLGYGLSDTYFSLKTGGMVFDYLENGVNVGTVPKDPTVIGFVGSQLYDRLNKSLAFGVQSKGSGDVVYLIDNPLYRGFWENGKLLFSNALFLVK